MSTSEIASTYAKALLNLGSSKKEFEKHLKDLELMIQVLNQPGVMKFFSSPEGDLKQKSEIINTVLEKHPISKEVLDFVSLLLIKRRLKYLPEILRDYQRLLQEKFEVMQVRFITAIPIGQTSAKKLKDKLEKQYGKTVQLETEVDPQLLGGGILLIGNKMLDFSIRNKLNKLKENLLSIHV